MAQAVKNPPVLWEIWIWFLGWEDPLEQEKATDSSSLAWGISWTEEPGGHSPWSLRVGRDWADTHARLRNNLGKAPSTVLKAGQRLLWPGALFGLLRRLQLHLLFPWDALGLFQKLWLSSPYRQHPTQLPPKHLTLHNTESCPGTKVHTLPMVEQNPLTQAPFSSPESSKEVRGVCGDRSSETWLLNVY